MQLFSDYAWQNTYRYFGLSTVAFFVLLTLQKKATACRPLPPSPKRNQLRREILFSSTTIVVTAFLAPVILFLDLVSNLNFYFNISTYGWPYFLFSIFLMMFIRDTLFYWEHRMMHQPRLYRMMHHLHHLSVRVTPFSGFSVHPFEACLSSVIPYALILFFIPKHPAAGLAAIRHTEESFKKIEAAYLDMEKAGADVEAGLEPDLRFHQAIFATTNNNLLSPLVYLIEAALRETFRAGCSAPGAKLNSLPLHKNVLEAIRNGDRSGAEKATLILLKEALEDMEAMHRITARTDPEGV